MQVNDKPAEIYADDEIDISELLGHLWAGKWVIVASMLFCLLLAVGYLHFVTYRYTTTLVLAPVQSDGGNKLGGLSGLASMAGINLPQVQGDLSMAMYKEGIHSRALADIMAKDQLIMRKAFKKEWNVKERRWMAPKSVLGPYVKLLKKILGFPVYRWHAPDGARLQDFISRKITVTQENKSPFLIITMIDNDPIFSRLFIKEIHENMDKMLRTKSLHRTTENINYLSNQLNYATLSEHRMYISQLISEQEKQRMLAKGSGPYAADPFGSISTDPRPSSPKPVMLILMSLLVGFILSCLSVLVAKRIPQKNSGA